MDLYSGVEYWLTQNGTAKQWPVLDQDINCDVVVIGAGVSGALTAWHLIEAGVETVVVDRRFVGGGSTAASTALLLYETDKHLIELIEMRGEKMAVRAWHLFRETGRKIADIVNGLNDSCGFEWKSAYYLASTKPDGKLLQKEYEVRRKHGFEMSFLSRQDLKQETSFNREAALLTPDAGQIDPYHFSHQLIEQAVTKGLRLYEQTAVIDYQDTKTGVLLRTDQGWNITAKNVIFASGYETQQYLQRDIISLASSYALASKRLSSTEGWPETALVWETARPYLYVRTTSDGRAIVGGADEKFYNPELRDLLISKKCRQLKYGFQELFPDIRLEMEYCWAGTFGETKDSLPYFGKIIAHPNALFNLSYGANGVIFSLVGAEIMRDMVLGRKNPDADIFDLER